MAQRSSGLNLYKKTLREVTETPQDLSSQDALETQENALRHWLEEQLSTESSVVRLASKELPSSQKDLGSPLLQRSALDRVARFVLTLDKAEISRLFEALPEKDVEMIVRAMIQVDRVSSEEKKALHEEFSALSKTLQSSIKGGESLARDFLNKALRNQEDVEHYLEKSRQKTHQPFDFLADVTDLELRELFSDEKPLSLAVIVPYLKKEQLRVLMKNMAPLEQKELMLRIGHMEKVHREILMALEHKIHVKLNVLRSARYESFDGKAALAEILNHMPEQKEAALLASLDLEPSDLASISEKLFSIDVVLRMDDEDIHRVLIDYSDRDIALLLREKSESIRQKILNNLSQRRRYFVEDENDVLGLVPLYQVKEVTYDFVEDLKRRYQDGEVNILRKDEDLI